MSTDALNQINSEALSLVVRARKSGVVVTIHTVPRQPPAMGNYYMSVDVRPARHAPQTPISEAQASRIGVDMTIEEAIAFADEWSSGMTFFAGSQGWRVVCRLLADEVRRLASEKTCETEALRDMLDSARHDLEVIRESLGVPIEPHQSLMERMVEAAEAKSAVRPDVEEVARLAHAYADAKLTRYGLLSPDPTSADPERAFVALYLAIKAIAVERDQFRGATKLVPAAWQVWCGLGNMQPYWPVFRTKEEADDTAKTIKTYTEVRPLWSHASAAPQPVGAKIVGGAA